MDKALQVRDILSTRGLTLYNVSRQSARIFGRSSGFYVPHNLYYDLARTFSLPTIYQMLALSHITDYRLSDWLAVFGFDLDVISRLQLLLLRQQTTVLDSTVYDPDAWIPSCRKTCSQYCSFDRSAGTPPSLGGAATRKGRARPE